MIIHDLIHQVKAGKRKRARKAMARRWAVGLCVATTAASLGVVTGVLIAPKAGKETREDLKKCVEKSVDTIEKVIESVADDK